MSTDNRKNICHVHDRSLKINTAGHKVMANTFCIHPKGLGSGFFNRSNTFAFLKRRFQSLSSFLSVFISSELTMGPAESLIKYIFLWYENSCYVLKYTFKNSTKPVRGSWHLWPNYPPVYEGHRWRFLSSGVGLACWGPDTENPPGFDPNHLNRSLHWCYSSLRVKTDTMEEGKEQIVWDNV